MGTQNYPASRKIKVIMSDSLWKIIIRAKKWGNTNQNNIKINVLKLTQKLQLFTNKDTKQLLGKIEHVMWRYRRWRGGSN